MNVIKKKWKELVYSMSTEDHYAEYDPNDSSNFNMTRRANQNSGGIGASRIHLTSTDGFVDEEMSVGMESGNNDISIEDFSNTDNEGVSEVMLAWRHIESWTTEHNPDLNASFGDPCTENDIIHAEEDLEITFPSSVKVSLRIHDGQEDLESMTGVSGLIYGLQLMTLDQIAEMTEKWRSVAKNLNKRAQNPPLKVNQDSSSPSSANVGPDDARKKQFKLSHIPVQSCVPKNTIQPAYAHPAWIPLVTDHAGNHIGVDLAPAEAGKYAQVIIFGRDFDTKYVIADNWGDFLLSFANDLEAGNWYLIDDSDDFLAGDGDLVFRDKKSNGPAQDYLEVLKKRVWSKENKSKNESTPASSPKTTDGSTVVETTNDKVPVAQNIMEQNPSEKRNFSEPTTIQVDEAITESETKSKDLEIPVLEVTNDAQAKKEYKKEDSNVEESASKATSAGQESLEEKKTSKGDEKVSEELAATVKEKLTLDNPDTKKNGSSVVDNEADKNEENNDQTEKAEIENDKPESNKQIPHKEEFESVAL